MEHNGVACPRCRYVNAGASQACEQCGTILERVVVSDGDRGEHGGTAAPPTPTAAAAHGEGPFFHNWQQAQAPLVTWTEDADEPPRRPSEVLVDVREGIAHALERFKARRHH